MRKPLRISFSQPFNWMPSLKSKLSRRSIDILYLGSFQAVNFSSSTDYVSDLSISGTVISLKHSLSSLKSRYPELNIIPFDLNLLRLDHVTIINLPNALYSIFSNFFHLLRLIAVSRNILFNVSPHGLAYSFIFIIAAKVLGSSFFIRCFGGRYLLDLPFLLGLLNKCACKLSSGVLLQTKKQCLLFAEDVSSVPLHWLPTSRPEPNSSELGLLKANFTSGFSKKFVYIGHIRKDKGIDFLVEAFNDHLDDSFSLDLYGPLWGQLGETERYNLDFKICNSFSIFYAGVVEPSEIYRTLSGYDALIFPTISPAEGYPGIVIESMMLGLPILSSRWHCLPEILDQDNSVLFEPYSARSIADAVKYYSSNQALRNSLHLGCLSDSSRFTIETQTDILYNAIYSPVCSS